MDSRLLAGLPILEMRIHKLDPHKKTELHEVAKWALVVSGSPTYSSCVRRGYTYLHARGIRRNKKQESPIFVKTECPLSIFVICVYTCVVLCSRSERIAQVQAGTAYSYLHLFFIQTKFSSTTNRLLPKPLYCKRNRPNRDLSRIYAQHSNLSLGKPKSGYGCSSLKSR